MNVNVLCRDGFWKQSWIKERESKYKQIILSIKLFYLFFCDEK